MDELKKIWIESAISRIPGILPFIEIVNGVATYVFPDVQMYNGNYGKLIVDVKIDDERFRDKPVSYRELRDMYSRFTVQPPVGDKDIKLFDGIKKVFGIVDVPSTIEGIDVPSFFYLPELSEWRDWFNKTHPFCSGGTTNECVDCCTCQEYEKRGGNSMHDWLNRKWMEIVINGEWELVYKWKNNQYTYITPYKEWGNDEKDKLYASLSCNIILTSKIDAFGIGTPIVKNWVPGERYYGPWFYGETNTSTVSSGLGEGVIYNGEVYYLKNNLDMDNPSWNIDTDRYEYIHGVDINPEDGKSGPQYWYVGLFDKMYQELLFDKEDENGNFVHWEKSIDNAEHNDLYYNCNDTVVVTTTTQSQLSSFKRIKNSVDDYGNVLPGIYVSGETKLQLPYLSGTAINLIISVDDDGNIESATGDIINKITYDYDNSLIIFDYVIGGNLIPINETTYVYKDGGIQYRDTYCLLTSTVTAMIDGEEKVLEYDILSSINCEMLSVNSDLSNVLTKVVMTNSTVFESTPCSTITDYSPFVYDEYLLGTISPPIVDTDISVDRGTAAAFERYLKLGEIKTLEDMENYGNGFFNLSEQS